MRFYHEKPTPHELGETRLVTQFLLFPRTINYETRWLESVVWRERCYRTGGTVNPEIHSWTPEAWVSP